MQEPVGVRVRRRVEDLPYVAGLHDSPRIHDSDVITKSRCHRQVVGYEDQGHVSLGTKTSDQLDDLRLHRHVKSSCRFVSD